MSQNYYETLKQLSDRIWDLAELKFCETQSAAALEDFMQQQGFRVERGVAGISTAFRCTFGRGKPVIGFLGEYDALSGLSQQAGAVQPCPCPALKPKTATAAGTTCWAQAQPVRRFCCVTTCSKRGKAAPWCFWAALPRKAARAKLIWHGRACLMIWMPPSPGTRAAATP